MDLLSKFSQMARFLKFAFSDHSFTPLAAERWQDSYPVDRNLEFFLISHIDILFIFGQCGDNCKLNLFLKRKVGATELPRSLNPIKAIAMAIFPIIVHFRTCARARCMMWHVDLRAQ